jgi:hypothetical protein
MTGQKTIDQPVTIVDNGIRSFIPPTFCFELFTDTGERVAVVSRLEAAGSGLCDFDVLEALRGRSLRAIGLVEPYDAGPEARREGLRFVVRGTVDGRGTEADPSGL